MREGWVRIGCGVHGSRNTLRCPRPSRVITPILASPVVFLVRKAHCQRCAPAAVRPDFFIEARQIGQSLALGERDLTR